MATVKVKFRPSVTNGKEGHLYYQVIQARTVRQKVTDCRLFSEEWDELAENVRISAGAPPERKAYLYSVAERIRWGERQLETIIGQLEAQGKRYTADDVIRSFRPETCETTLSHYMEGEIVRLKQLGRVRTSETYGVALASFLKFRNGHDILLCELDDHTMMRYEAWLKAGGLCPNSTSFYMRILRAAYNRAAEAGVIEQRNPFRHVFTGIDKTVKRAIPLSAVRCIKELDLRRKPHLDYARDLFLFSFYTRGMSFVDMAYLRKSDLKHGAIVYRRRKTGQLLVIRWERCMEELVNKYAARIATPYLLPIITNPRADERKQYQNALYRVNTALKEIARLVNLSFPLTMYCARHGWASIARSKNIPVSVISEGMGHVSEQTTRIYLASLDNEVIDDANSLILNDL